MVLLIAWLKINTIYNILMLLKLCSEPGDLRPSGPSRPLVPDLLSHRLTRSSPERNTASAAASKPPLTSRGWIKLFWEKKKTISFFVINKKWRSCTFTFFPLGGGGVVWTKLQEVLSSVEESISCKRSWAAPITASDRGKHQEHLRAAQESWVKAAQVTVVILWFI